MTDGRVAIEATGLCKSFGSVDVLTGVDLAVERGTLLALLGQNGAGKTTFVRILTTLLRPDRGRGAVNGYDVVRQANDVRASIGLTGQNTAVDKLLTGRENLVMMGRLCDLGPAGARRRAEQLLEQFELVDAADRQVKTYSGGMRRRLDLSISLITAPPVLFLDEPTTGLDPRSRLTMWDTIRALLGGGTTVLLTTQYLEEADRLADQVAVLDGGRIVAQGTPNELKRKVGTDRAELSFADEAAFDRAGELLRDENVRGDRQQATLSIPMHDVKQLKCVLDRMESGGVEVTGLAVTKPTLDDVLLAVIGRPATRSAGQEERTA
ncbi:MAG TPA: ATP-binding cassette domain-containing protein [Pseudonocardiaceae bacterium]|nr:ATP-binding cassette domain-containing protein [Pseudonocardiaceae bacterium]